MQDQQDRDPTKIARRRVEKGSQNRFHGITKLGKKFFVRLRVNKRDRKLARKNMNISMGK